MIEISTDVHTRHDELLTQLRQIRYMEVMPETGSTWPGGGGTHPFQRWFDRRIFSTPRFIEISGLYGYLAKQFTVFGPACAHRLRQRRTPAGYTCCICAQPLPAAFHRALRLVAFLARRGYAIRFGAGRIRFSPFP